MRKLEDILLDNQKNLDVSEKKKFLRKILLQEREKSYRDSSDSEWGPKQYFRALELLQVSDKELSAQIIAKKILVASFFPIRCELDLSRFASEDWIFPFMTLNKELLWFKYGDGKTNYKVNKYGIREKDIEHCFAYDSTMPPMICFLPGLAASVNGYRLGYGGGYYDRFIAKNRENIKTIFCLPSGDFLFNDLPIDNNDQKVDLIVW